MTRVTKEPEVRRNEILNAAQRLFNTKGYEKTSISDIVSELGIAKGTVYYYFRTKEELFNAIAERYCSHLIQEVSQIAEDSSLNVMQKIEHMLYAEYRWDTGNIQLMDQLHTWKKLEMNQRIFINIIHDYSPIISKVIDQGVQEGLFQTDYPLETARLIMSGHRMLFDQAYFSWSGDEILKMAKAHQDILECALRAQKGSFSFIERMVESYYEARA